MAYKPTRQKQYKVAPVQVASSGGHQLAQMIDSISGNISAIGTAYRKEQFNEARLDAEAEANINSVNYTTDKNGKTTLDNLTNFNYSKIDQINDARDRQVIAQVYKTTAIANYVNAKTKDMDQYVGSLFAKSPTNFKAIMSAKEGYIEGLNIKDPMLRAALLPNVEHTFSIYANRAKANAEKIKRAEAIDNSIYTIDMLASELKGINANALINGAKPDQNARQKYILQTEIPKQKAIWIANGKSEAEFNAYIAKMRSSILSHTARTKIKVMYKEEGAKATFDFIYEQATKLAVDPKALGVRIDVPSYIKDLENELGVLQKQTKLKQDELSKNRAKIYGKAQFDITTGKITTEEEIKNLAIGDGQKSSLIQHFRNQMGFKDTEIKKEHTKVFENLFNRFQFPENYATEELSADDVRSLASLEIKFMKSNNLIDEKQYSQFLTTDRKITAEIIKSQNLNFTQSMKFQMENDPSFFKKPSYFSTLLKERIKSGKFNDGTKINQVTALIREYAKKHKAYHAEQNLIQIGLNNRIRNIPNTNPKVIAALEKSMGGDIINYQSDKQDGLGFSSVQKQSPPNIMSDEDNLRTQSVGLTISRSYSTGILHPHLKDQFLGTSWVQNEDDFRKIQSAWVSFVNESVKETGSAWMARNMAQKAGVNLSLMTSAKDQGFETTKKLSQLITSSSDRKINSIGGNKVFGDSFDTTFKEVIRDESWYEWVFGREYVSSGQQDKLDLYKDQTETNSLSEALLNNSRVRKLIVDRTQSIFETNPFAQGEDGLKRSIVQAMSELTGVIGLQDTPQGPEWTMFPIVQTAKASAGNVPLDWDNDEWMNRVKTDTIEKLLTTNAVYSPEMKSAIEDGRLLYIYNDNSGSTPSYTVYVDMDDGLQPKEVFKNYKYNFFQSNDNEDYKNALAEIKDSWWRNLMYSIPGLKSHIVNSTASDWAENNDFDSTIKKLAYGYNLMSNFINNKLDTKLPSITKEDRQAVQNFLELYLTGY